MNRAKRLKTLVELQAKLTALHEMRHAGLMAKAAQAAEEAADLARHADRGSDIAGLFSELYARRIVMARAREDVNRAQAGQEARLVATHTLRGKAVERAYRTARQEDERQRSDRERLEIIEQKRNRE